jgi:hypothetical protein
MMILVLYWNSLLPWDHRPASLQQPHYIQPTCNLLHKRTLHYIYIYTFLAKTPRFASGCLLRSFPLHHQLG